MNLREISEELERIKQTRYKSIDWLAEEPRAKMTEEEIQTAIKNLLELVESGDNATYFKDQLVCNKLIDIANALSNKEAKQIGEDYDVVYMGHAYQHQLKRFTQAQNKILEKNLLEFGFENFDLFRVFLRKKSMIEINKCIGELMDK